VGDSLFNPVDAATDMQLLEKTIQQLVVDYELFFAARADGKLKVLPPHRRVAEVEAILRHYIKHPPHRTVHRFRFNTLVHRYRTQTERWRRRMKLLEEKGVTARAAASSAREVEDLSKPQVLAATRLPGGQPSGNQLRDIFLAYKTARKARGLPVATLAYASFADRLAGKIGVLRQEAPDRDIELRVDEFGGMVRVAVRPMAPREAQSGATVGVGDGETREV